MAEETKPEQLPSTSTVDEITVLRQTLTEKENSLKGLEKSKKDSETKFESQAVELLSLGKEIAGLREKLGGAAAKYRQIILSSSPEVPEELVKGETVEEVEASFANARQVVERVKQGLEGKQQRERVPTGAPPRSPLDVSAMSPQEKIVYALRKGG
ncbi:MAG: hypothetical protein Q7R34_03285 [Dehalococcoidia bacterium]|nr:hypothetical protein [Dehalococcoidia bacterium]